ncbi:hypothetical protein MIR68_000099 [Amoeboaphelidium protococcarum]|nr:hypothetical protein MIR68_000099 [Amoeboaphelidium protococcarum]
MSQSAGNQNTGGSGGANVNISATGGGVDAKSLNSSSASISINQQDLIPQQILRQLGDKFYDKRKQGALEVEKIVRDLLNSGQETQYQRVVKILNFIKSEFMQNVTSSHMRNGGLIAMAAVSICIPQESELIHQIVPPVLNLLTDTDSRTKYYATETLYNIIKSHQYIVCGYFNELFDILLTIVSDSENSVRNGGWLVVNQVLDIVSNVKTKQSGRLKVDHVAQQQSQQQKQQQRKQSVQSDGAQSDPLMRLTGWSNFRLDRFVPLLSTRIYSQNTQARLFLLKWLQSLDSVPQFELISYLIYFLDGLLLMVGHQQDKDDEVSDTAVNLLAELLNEISSIYSHQLIESSSEIVTQTQNSGQQVVQQNARSQHNDHEEFVEQGEKSHQGVHLSFLQLIDILLPHISPQSLDELSLVRKQPIINQKTQQIAIEWIKTLVRLDGKQVLPAMPKMISVTLPCIDHSYLDIREIAAQCNNEMKKLVISSLTLPEQLKLDQIIDSLTLLFLSESELTRAESLEWLVDLQKNIGDGRLIFEAEKSSTFPALIQLLTDVSERVVVKDLDLLSLICRQRAGLTNDGDNNDGQKKALYRESSESQFVGDSVNEEFQLVIKSILQLFSTDKQLLEKRGSLIIRRLCTQSSPSQVYGSIAAQLLATYQNQDSILGNNARNVQQDASFIVNMVRHLNVLLMTCSELSDLRRYLQQTNQLGVSQSHQSGLYKVLYDCWSSDSVSLLSLCLISQQYEDGAQLINRMAESGISISELVQLDKLVQLLESPSFAYMRLQLLQPSKYSALYKCLYGVLMLLPQSSAFVTLKNRLGSVSAIGNVLNQNQS